MDLATITSAQMLAIPENMPERLFSEPAKVASEYRTLAKRLHPDVPTGDKSAFQRLNELHVAAEAKIKNGEWLTPGVLILKGDDATEKRIRFVKEYDAGVGRGYIGRTLVTFVLPPDLNDLAGNAHKVIDGLATVKYPSDKIRQDFEYRRPRIKRFFRTVDGKSVLVVEKPEDVVRLRDILDYSGGTLDPRHVAWIMSEMHNLSCWLDMMKLTHNDLSLDSVFISPSKHTAMVLGGWWFAVAEGSRMQRVQLSRTIANAPHAVIDTKKASIKTDLSLIRLMGRELLGDDTGASLVTKVHPVLANWLRIATTGNAREDYRLWNKVMTDALGERRFTEMNIKPTDVYKE